jgi:hypothetical protein
MLTVELTNGTIFEGPATDIGFEKSVVINIPINGLSFGC